MCVVWLMYMQIYTYRSTPSLKADASKVIYSIEHVPECHNKVAHIHWYPRSHRNPQLRT